MNNLTIYIIQCSDAIKTYFEAGSEKNECFLFMSDLNPIFLGSGYGQNQPGSETSELKRLVLALRRKGFSFPKIILHHFLAEQIQKILNYHTHTEIQTHRVARPNKIKS